jgi:hypothetical protein
MKKNYNVLQLVVIEFTTNDVCTASTGYAWKWGDLGDNTWDQDVGDF